MANPIQFLQQFNRGMRQDEPRTRMLKGAVWNLVDYVPDLGAPLRKRGGWSYASGDLSATVASASSIPAVAYANFNAGAQLLAWTSNDHMVLVSSTSSATDKGACQYPLQPPVMHVNKLVIPARDGTTGPKMYDGTSLANLGGTPPAGKYATTYKDRTYLASTAADPQKFYASKGGDPETWDTTNTVLSVLSPITGIAALPNALLVFQETVTSRIRGSTPPPGSDMTVDDPFFAQGCSDARSIQTSGAYAIFANRLGVWRSNGTSVPEDLTAAVGLKRYWKDLLAGYARATWTLSSGLIEGRYVIAVLNDSTFLDCIAFDGATGGTTLRAYRFANVPAFSMASAIPAGELYFGSRNTARVGALSTAFTPSATYKADANGTAVTPILETPYMFDDGVQKDFRTVLLGLDMRDAASDNPVMTVSYIKNPDDSYTAVTQTLAETTDYQNPTRLYLSATPGGGFSSPGLGLKLAQSNASSDTRVTMIRVEASSRERSRKAAA